MTMSRRSRNFRYGRTAASTDSAAGCSGNRGAIVRHGVINFFMIIILAPLAWVLMMSIKSRPDAMRGDFWPRKFDFTHYAYVFEKIDTLPINLFNSIYVTTGDGPPDHGLRGARGLCARSHAAARRRHSSSRRSSSRSISRSASSRSSASTRSRASSA